MKFPLDYPYSPPSIRFLTKVWHPNVYEVSIKNDNNNHKKTVLNSRKILIFPHTSLHVSEISKWHENLGGRAETMNNNVKMSAKKRKLLPKQMEKPCKHSLLTLLSGVSCALARKCVCLRSLRCLYLR